ncbi:MAG TPA: VOC family protein [Candidatus Aquilonibacter sp.]|nr:VOC family protein [Candidatus Aquilonibacter sp.]
MGLRENSPVAFIPTTQPVAAREFYEKTLGLHFESADSFAIVFSVGPEPGIMLRVTTVPDLTPHPFTIFGWQVDDIVASVTELAARGVQFTRYGFIEQDEHAIWNAPGGTKIAWFQDLDGNTLSLSQHSISVR